MSCAVTAEGSCEDGTILNVYKHHDTRRYLHLAPDGRAFVFEPEDRYRQVDTYRAVRNVFWDWERWEPDRADVAALDAVYRRLLGESDAC